MSPSHIGLHPGETCNAERLKEEELQWAPGVGVIGLFVTWGAAGPFLVGGGLWGGRTLEKVRVKAWSSEVATPGL